MWGALMRHLSRLLAIVTHDRDDRDLAQELDGHFAMLVDEHRRRGLSEEEARRAAHLTLGNATQLHEAHREVRGTPIVEELIRDLRYALRGFSRQPGFTAIAVLTLAVGIGANAAVFSIVHGVLMRPLAYGDPDELMSRDERRPADSRTGSAGAMDLAATLGVDAGRALVRRWRVPADVRGRDPGRAGTGSAAGRTRSRRTCLRILRVQPILGREFRPEEDADGAPPVALISERLWARRFGSDRSIVGQAISVGSVPYTVIGILPDGFQFPVRDIDVWFPKPANAPFVLRQYYACCSPLMGVARLRPGVTREQADAELAVLNTRYEPQGQRRVDAGPAVLAPLKDDIVGRVDTMLWMLLAAVGFVLLIACANVATLLMARATSRAREFALRIRARCRPGAPDSSARHREPGPLADRRRARPRRRLCGCPRGGDDDAVRAATSTRARRQRNGASVDDGDRVCDGRAVRNVPSLQLLKPAMIERLRQSGATVGDGQRGRGLVGVGTRGALVVVQVALSLVLLIGAALMVQTIARLARVDLGLSVIGTADHARASAGHDLRHGGEAVAVLR